LGAVLLGLVAGAPASADPAPAYGLDAISREIPAGGPVQCPHVDLVPYRGDVVRFRPGTVVYSGFTPHLRRLEELARDVAIEIYGRAPSRIVHLGTYACRRMTTYPDWLSEHGLGNAIDLEGFDFPPLPRGEALLPGLDKGFRGAFEVRVIKHWGKKTGHAAVHARFLRTIAARLVARPDAFRVVLGPGYPGHANHLHLDMSPFRLVHIYDGGELVRGEDAP
jgi:hypothetical protein